METALARKRPLPPICPVCHEIPFNPMMAQCGHSICGVCERKLLEKKCVECNVRSKYRINRMLRDVLASTFPEEYQVQRFRHTPEGWIEFRKRTDPSIELRKYTFPIEITMRLLRRMERMLWSTDRITAAQMYKFCHVSDSIWGTVTNKEALLCMDYKHILQVVKGDRMFSIFATEKNPELYESWIEDLD